MESINGIERAFIKEIHDHIGSISTSLENTLIWLRKHELLIDELECDICKNPMKIY